MKTTSEGELICRGKIRFQKEREETNQKDGNKKIWRFLKTKNRPENGKAIF